VRTNVLLTQFMLQNGQSVITNFGLRISVNIHRIKTYLKRKL